MKGGCAAVHRSPQFISPNEHLCSAHIIFTGLLYVFLRSFTALVKDVLQAPDRVGSVYLLSSQTQNKLLVFSGSGWIPLEPGGCLKK